MKHLIEAPRDGAKANPTPVASSQPFDLSSELRLDYLEGVKTFLKTNSIPKEKVAQTFFYQPHYSNLEVTY